MEIAHEANKERRRRAGSRRMRTDSTPGYAFHGKGNGVQAATISATRDLERSSKTAADQPFAHAPLRAGQRVSLPLLLKTSTISTTLSADGAASVAHQAAESLDTTGIAQGGDNNDLFNFEALFDFDSLGPASSLALTRTGAFEVSSSDSLMTTTAVDTAGIEQDVDLPGLEVDNPVIRDLEAQLAALTIISKARQQIIEDQAEQLAAKDQQLAEKQQEIVDLGEELDYMGGLRVLDSWYGDEEMQY